MLVTLKGGPYDGEMLERPADPIMGLMQDTILVGDNARYSLHGAYLAGPQPDSEYIRYAVYEFQP